MAIYSSMQLDAQNLKVMLSSSLAVLAIIMTRLFRTSCGELHAYVPLLFGKEAMLASLFAA